MLDTVEKSGNKGRIKMDDIKKSKNLEAVIREACNLGDGQKGVFTAEKFLYFLVNLIEIGKTWSSKELSDALEILKKHISSIENVRRLLKIYINRDNQDVFRDLAYMGQMMAFAWNDVKGLTVNGEPVGEVTISILLVKILKYPNDTIKNILNCDLNNAVRVDVTKSDMSDDEAGSDKLKPADHKVMKDIPKVAPVKDKNLQNNTETGNSEKVGMSQFVADAKRIREYLQGKVYGQENAVNVFIKGFFQASMLSAFDKERNRPRASFLFAGPPGVGKTFLAETAADALGLKFRRFDMSEYCDKEASIEFCGSDGVYKNNKKGNFTSFIMDNPKCVVLLDEIEKAHISIIHLFLQVLDAGRLRDSNTDEEVSFKDVILIFTTNAGKQLYTDSEYEDLSTIPRNVIINALEKDINPQTKEPYFSAAICSRFASGNVVMFNHIGASDLRLIAKKEIEERAESLEKETGIQMEIDESVYTSLLFSEGIKADARTTKGRAEAFFNEELYELLRLVSSDKVKTSIDRIEKIKISVDLNNISDDIKELFTLNSRKNMLVLAGKDTVELCEKRKPACTIIGVQTSKDAIEAIKKYEIDLILLDVTFGLSASEKLNIEDENSPARELLGILHEQKNSIPLYLLDYAKNPLDAEEKISFARQGVRGFLKISSLANFKLAETLNEILAVIHQQASMMNLARENKLVSFETSQSISKNGKLAEIKLFDFKKIVAVDAEDSKSILNPVSRPDVHFDDVIGADEAKKELAYFVGYMKNPKKYLCTGVKAPKGVLLYGPPGTGKTMLAKAMASEAGVTFIAAEGNQFAKKYAGEGPESVHALFAKARKYAPSILFIDEIDAIAKERRGTDSSADEATLTAFLTEMDGFKSDSTKPVFVLAATNFEVEPGKPKSLDPALMRRFDRRVYIEQGRQSEIFKNEAVKEPCIAAL